MLSPLNTSYQIQELQLNFNYSFIKFKGLSRLLSTPTPFIGRTSEISNLFLSLQNDRSITVLGGEAGIGKSALLNEFYDQLSKRENHFVGYFDRSKELGSANLIYPFVSILESLLKWISRTRLTADKVKETMSRMEKAFVKLIKEKGTEIAGALIQDIAEKAGLKETLKIAKDFLKKYKEERSATMFADAFVAENKTEIISSYMEIFNILKTEFQEHLFVLIFDQFENVGKGSIDFLIDFIRNLPSKFHVIVAFRSEDQLSDDAVAQKVNEYALRRLEELAAKEVLVKGLSAEEIGIWIKRVKGIDLPLIPDLRRIRESTDGVPIILNEWINHSTTLNYEEIDDFKKDSNSKKLLCKYVMEHKRALGDDIEIIKNLHRISIINKPINNDQLSTFLQIDSEDLQIFIDRLINVGIFEKRDNYFWFRHDLVRKCLEDSLTCELREKLHIKAAEFYLELFKEGERSGNVENYVYIACAYHLHNAGESMKDKCIQINRDLSQRASNIGELDLAERCYRRIISDAMEKDEFIEASLGLAHNVYVVWGRYDDAFAIYEQMLPLSSAKQSAQILSFIAQIHYMQGEHEKALEYYDSSFSAAEKIENQVLLGEILHGKAIIKYDEGKLDDAIDYFDQSKRILIGLGNKTGEILCSCRIGDIYRVKKEYDKAIELLEKCLQESEKLSNPAIRSEILYYMANVYYDKQKYDDSITSLKERLSIEESLGNQHGIAMTLFGIGKSLNKTNEFTKSLSYLQPALSILKRISHDDAELVEIEIISIEPKLDQSS